MVEMLSVIALLASIISMIISCAAMWPHSESNLTRLRDGILWLSFLFVLVGLLTYGWTLVEQTFVVSPSGFPANASDEFAYPRPSAASSSENFAGQYQVQHADSQRPVVHTSRRTYPMGIGHDRLDLARP